MAQKETLGITIREWPPVMPIKQASKEVGVSEMTMYELIARHEIQSLKIGNRRHIISKSLLAYIDRQKKASQPKEPGVVAMHAARASKRRKGS